MIEVTIEHVAGGRRSKLGFLRIVSLSDKRPSELQVELWDRDPRNVEVADPAQKLATNPIQGAVNEPMNTGRHRFGWLMLTIATAFNSLRPTQSLPAQEDAA